MQLFLLFAALAAASGQTAQFEVVSIKPAAPQQGPTTFMGNSGGPGSNDPERWRCQNLAISNLITLAFNIRPNDISGPDWLREPRFDINAKVPPGATRAQLGEMLQNMLKDRFGLKYHVEKREVAGFVLTIAKDGPKFKERAPDAPDPGPGFASNVSSDMSLDASGFPVVPPGRSATLFAGDRVRGQWPDTTMDNLARRLTIEAGKPVVNATGLTRRYEISIYWVRENSFGRPTPGAEMVSASDVAGGPTLFRAVQEQLGLKLETKKVPQDILIVDDVKRVPTEN